ncbi:c-di-GMP-binding flagellar brake protein YcgR, contains PilZNR and PilZ domains [Acetitomaculum ruminis DSM 5522]|uniref:C-di-GMP-binding flagellar brake protein YcgR, contains PilZNR and PilZ domains n=1 Tax=Acetitomaculum ruminis DSM 5522 TaxID=1120918 RepID=A0A1I0ZJK7_9FIRM|nr:flagellar brake domain-containing protein [Acetitomaculum ruminis]SFB25296.1 c-di-GMP-binding flagellar brake protein YcgR, contains PilZNR and PilZ domains [Acetitomaculum ruminis DSM 5522]
MIGSLNAGDKVDISYTEEGQIGKELNIDTKHFYKSKIYETDDNGVILTMPIEEGRLVPLPVSLKYNVIFYTDKGLYKSTGLIERRYKEGRVYVFYMTLLDKLVRYQRRQYFRVECILDFRYLKLDETKDFKSETLEGILFDFENNYQLVEKKNGLIVDISAGGVRAIVKEEYEKGSYYMISFELVENSTSKNYELPIRIVSCEPARKTDDNSFEVRAEFAYITEKIREELIKFIFAKERRTLKSGKGK